MEEDQKNLDNIFEEISSAQKNILVSLERIKTELGNDDNSFAEQAADRLCRFLGSWKYILIQSMMILLWITINVYFSWKWDVYPFILLNLVLSFQAATASPIILMSQNLAVKKDRKMALSAYHSIHKIEEMLKRIRENVNLFKNGNGHHNGDPGTNGKYHSP